MDALIQFMDFRPETRHSAFHKLARMHVERGIGASDVDAFRRSFIDEVAETFASQAKCDAWNAALKRGLAFLKRSD
jgi:hypothetical protein